MMHKFFKNTINIGFWIQKLLSELGVISSYCSPKIIILLKGPAEKNFTFSRSGFFEPSSFLRHDHLLQSQHTQNLIPPLSDCIIGIFLLLLEQTAQEKILIVTTLTISVQKLNFHGSGFLLLPPRFRKQVGSYKCNLAG